MAISFVGSKEFASDTDSSTTYTITDPLPTGLQVGDVCVIAIACPSPTAGALAFSGWTLVYEGLDGTQPRGSVWYRVIQAGDTTTTDFTFDPPGTAEGIAWITSLYRGVKTDTPFIAQNGAFSNADADFSLISPTVANTDPDAWVVSAGIGSDTATADASVTWTATGSGWTPVERNDIDPVTATTAQHTVGFYDSNATVTTGNKSATHTLGAITVATDMMSWIGVLWSDSNTGTVDMVASTVGTSNSGVGDQDVTINKPTGTAEGDLMLAFLTTNATVFDSPPAGWTQERHDTVSTFGNSIWYKVAGASEGASYTWAYTDANSAGAPFVGTIMTFRRVSGNPINGDIVVTTSSVNETEALTTPTVTTAVALGKVVYFRCCRINPAGGVPITFDPEPAGVFCATPSATGSTVVSGSGATAYSHAIYADNADYIGSGSKTGKGITAVGAETHNIYGTFTIATAISGKSYLIFKVAQTRAHNW